MRYIISCLLIIIGLTQCTKDNPGSGDAATVNIFNIVTDPNYLLDTLTVSIRQTNDIRYGYCFSYDNLNRVTQIKCYEYFGNMPFNSQGTWTFSYQADSTKPQSMHQMSYNDYRVYFFYNDNGSKNRDSMVSSVDPSIRAVRKYAYDSAFKYAVVRHYNNGSLKPTLEDSATFKNYNCNAIYSKEITWSGSVPYTYEWFSNFYPQVDKDSNPLSKMNIFPALFLAPYLHLGYKIDGDVWRGSFIMDFAFQNNPTKYKFYQTAIGGYNYTYINSGEGETYDSKKRIVRKDFADSAGTLYNIRYSDRFYATYKYR